MNSLTLEDIKKCRECSRKLKYMGTDGYVCPDCEKRGKDEKK